MDRDERPIELDTRDVIDLGGPGESPWLRNKWMRWLPLVVVAAVAAYFGIHHATTDRTEPAPVPTPLVTAPSGPSGAPGPIPSGTVTEAGPRLLGITAGWNLFARTPDGIARIEFASGRITTTGTPALQSSGPVSFIAGGGWALIKPLDHVPGYLIDDGQPAQALTWPVGDGLALPGPDPAHVWIDVTPGDDEYLELADPHGRPTSARIDVPDDMRGTAQPDGAGYMLLSGNGGIYDTRPSGLTRVTTGALLAIGPNTYFVADCDTHHVCANVVTNRSTGARTVIPRYRIRAPAVIGIISPDGRTESNVVQNADGSIVVHLIDLTTGADWASPVAVSDQFDVSAMVWSPDSRWLFVPDSTGALEAVNAPTRTVHDVDLPIGPFLQLAIRD